MTARMRAMISGLVFSIVIWSLLFAGGLIVISEKPHDEARSNSVAVGEG